MKDLILSALTHDVMAPLLRPLSRGVAPILYLHRFTDGHDGVRGHPVAALRANLALLRRNRYQILSLTELLGALEDGRPLDRTVVFTVDDGYEDFARVAVPVFAEFDCPVTIFLTTGFMDRAWWCWWDRITLALDRTGRTSLDLDLGAGGGGARSYRWQTAEERLRVESDLMERCKRLSTPERLAALAQIVAALEVDIPNVPPPAFAPMTWDDVRAIARHGVTFGAHTVTHPLLSRATDDEARREITESWRRVREETDAAVPIFCYPNGTPDSYGPREFALLRDAGLSAAVTTEQSYTSARTLAASTPEARYAIPRFAYFDERPQFLQVVSGIERAKQALRG